jgi:predicted  nucleic acid-binding Zn-ribbon protein
VFDPSCAKCGEFYNPKRASLGYRTCLDCGSPKQEFIVIEVSKSNPVVGTRAELLGSHKGLRTW